MQRKQPCDKCRRRGNAIVGARPLSESSGTVTGLWLTITIVVFGAGGGRHGRLLIRGSEDQIEILAGADFARIVTLASAAIAPVASWVETPEFSRSPAERIAGIEAHGACLGPPVGVATLHRWEPPDGGWARAPHCRRKAPDWRNN